MTCRLAIIVAMVAGCSAVDAPLVKLSGSATTPMSLMAPATAPDTATLSWRIAERPPGSVAESPADGSTTTFVPDVRGTYLIDLWLSDGVSDDLEQRFEIDVAGTPPVPIIALGPPVTAGSTITADANQSYSPEELSLTFRWRLAVRPQASVATLASNDAATTSFFADVAGGYVVELSAFDGELWSAPVTATIEVDP